MRLIGNVSKILEIEITKQKIGGMKMLRPKFKGYTIEIELPEECGYTGYSIECTFRYLKSQEKYLVSMWLKRNDISDRFKIDSQEINTLPLSGTKETIVDNICRVIEQGSLSGFFDDYIKRFEYTYSWPVSSIIRLS